MPQDCTWVFGRGASIANGLSWVVPQEWKDDLISKRVTRDTHVHMIAETLREEIARVPRGATPYRRLLDFMSTKTVAKGHHTLITTNWDDLLQRDVNDWVEANTSGYAPRFLCTPGTVYHLNGCVEPGKFKHGSPFLLETDAPSDRKSTFEANQALTVLLSSTLVIVVGMSFECDMDRGLLATLRVHGDSTLIGQAYFVIVEPNGKTLESTYAKLVDCFPRANGIKVNKGFAEWIDSGMAQLVPRLFTL